MAVNTSQLAPESRTLIPGHTMHRLSRALFSFLQTVASSHVTDQLDRRQVSIAQLRGREVASALELRYAHFALPSDFKLVPDRITQTATLQAAGFSDSRSRSVGVDLARWTRPCAPELDEIAWRRVFTWIVGTDNTLKNVSLVAPPERRGNRMSGSYGYEADGVPGYGVLQVAVAEDGAWQICDCWGDATDADRIDEIAATAGTR